MFEELKKEIERYKITNRRLNRRCQKLEKLVFRYRRRYVAILNPAREWTRRAEWEYRRVDSLRKDLFRQLSFGYFHWSWFKSTIRIINQTINTFFQRLLILMKTGHFFPESVWVSERRLKELEAKIIELESKEKNK